MRKRLRQLFCSHNARTGVLPTRTGDGWEKCTRCGKFWIKHRRVTSPVRGTERK